MSQAGAVPGFFAPKRMLKIGLAILFDLLKFAFALFFIFLPLIVGVAAGVWAADKCDKNVGEWVPAKESVCAGVSFAAGGAAGLLTGAVEFVSGAGVVAIQVAGEVVSDAINALAWLTFTLWALISGRKFFGTKRATNRLLILLGSSAAGLVPIVHAGPTITMGVIAMEWQDWLEQKEKAQKAGVAQPSRAQRIADQRQQLAPAAETAY